MANKLLKYLNNQIVIWENIYGDIYNFLYNPDGSQKPEEVNNKYLYSSLREAEAVMQTLHKIKRNRFKDVKRPEKRKYKINWYGRG